MNKFVASAFALALFVLPAAAETPVPEGDYANLQATMQAHIERNLVDGAMLQVDEKSGKIQQLYPAKAHPKIMLLGNYYYLCADFRDAEGKDVMINFVAAKNGDRYVIFHTIIGENEELEHLIGTQPKLASN